MFQEARNSTDPYPAAQALFSRGQAPGEDDTFEDVFKSDFIVATSMKARRKMRAMRMDPYPDAIIRRGLTRKEPRETAHPILEEAMMFTSVMGVELMEGLAITSDTVDRMVLESLERMMDPVGRTLGNPILIEDDLVEDVVVAGGSVEDMGRA